jgi:exopolysaccharide biosynthesis polyprenyl glycosylphosphotransferase
LNLRGSTTAPISTSLTELPTAVTPELAAKLTLHGDPLHEALRPALAAEVVIDQRVDADGAHVVDERARKSGLRRAALHHRVLAVADVLAVTTTVALVFDVNQHRLALMALAMPLVIVPFKIAGIYDRDELRLVQSTLDEVPILMQLTALFALAVVIAKWLLEKGTLGAQQIVALWLGAFAAIVICRTFARWLAGRLTPLERCLVIGELDRAKRIRERVASSHARAAVVASLRLGPEDIEDPGASEAIRRLVRELAVERIVVAPSSNDDTSAVGLIRFAKAVGVRVSVLPRMFEVVGSAVEFDDVDGMTMLGIRCFGLSRSSRALKRGFDLGLASLGLLLAAPLMAAVALAVSLDSRGPVLFRQVRVGRDGRHFVIFKFRTMVRDAETHKDRLRAYNEAGDGLFKIANDPRVTRMGKLLRRTSLDELPQLFNVVRGEMSLVGPRPLVVDEDAQVLGFDRGRLHLTPGMTGPWQVLGRRVPMQEMVGIDYLYVANWSLWFDVKILLRTVRHVVRHANL